EEMGELLEPKLYDTDPENAWKRLKPRRHSARYVCVMRRLAAWRERTAQVRDQPRGRVMKDDAIDELATQTPLDMEALERLRSLPRGFAGSRFAPEVLEAIREGLKDSEHFAPEPKHAARAPGPPVGPVVELLKVLLKARADEAHVASKLIATVADLEMIAADDEADTPALHGWRREAFGEDAIRLKRGELALVLDGAKLRVVEVRRRPRTADEQA
ncbi:MAG TPA: HRDC domain-containing protein, partial [Roseiarcus sp.]